MMLFLSGDGAALVRELEKNGIRAEKIGHLTEDNDKCIRNGEERRSPGASRFPIPDWDPVEKENRVEKNREQQEEEEIHDEHAEGAHSDDHPRRTAGSMPGSSRSCWARKARRSRARWQSSRKRGIICQRCHTMINWDSTGVEKVTALIEMRVTPQRGSVGFDDICRAHLQNSRK